MGAIEREREREKLFERNSEKLFDQHWSHRKIPQKYIEMLCVALLQKYCEPLALIKNLFELHIVDTTGGTWVPP